MSFDPEEIQRQVLAEVELLLTEAIAKVEPLTGRVTCQECGTVKQNPSLTSETFRALNNALNNGRQSVTAARRRLASGYFV